MPEGCVAIQKDLHSLEKCAGRNLMKFSKGKCQVLHLGRNNPRHEYMLRATKQETNLAEKDLEVQVKTKLTMSQQCTLAAKAASGVLGYIRQRYFQQVKEGDPGPLLSTGGATPGVLCPVLGSSVQERHGHAGHSQMKCHKDDQGTGASLL